MTPLAGGPRIDQQPNMSGPMVLRLERRVSLADAACFCSSGPCTTCAAWRRVWRRIATRNASIRAG